MFLIQLTCATIPGILNNILNNKKIHNIPVRPSMLALHNCILPNSLNWQGAQNFLNTVRFLKVS